MFDLYLTYEYHFAATQLVLAMLGIGATLRAEDISRVFRFPTAFGLGLGMQLLVVPLTAIVVGHLLAPHPGIVVGLVLVATLPGGTMSNLLVYFSRASLALSVSLTAVMTVGCLVTTPALLRLVAGPYLPDDFVMPVARVAFEMFVFLLGPLAAGMIVGRLAPDHREPFARWCIRGSLAVLSVIVVGASGAGRVDPVGFGVSGYVAIMTFCAIVVTSALLLGRATGLPAGDRCAIGIEVGIRNVNLGLLLKASIFPAIPGVPDRLADGVLFALLMYGAFGTTAAIVLALLHRRGLIVTREWHRPAQTHV